MDIKYDGGIKVDKSKATKTINMGTLLYPKESRLNKNIKPIKMGLRKIFMKNSSSKIDKMMDQVERFFTENPEEAQALLNKIDGMDIPGPTIDEYMKSIQVLKNKPKN